MEWQGNLREIGKTYRSIDRFLQPHTFVSVILVGFLLSLLLVCEWMETQVESRRLCSIEVNFGRKIGIIRSLQGVNNGPLSVGSSRSVDLSSYYLALNVTHVRLHDLWGAVDINHVFPDMDADPSVPENYNFTLTDKYLEAINSIGAKIIYRLGYSWETPPVHNVPPKDYEKWASICVQIIKHYNDGWADGKYYNIDYWEIWNEPDFTQFWTGTAEEYYRLYEVTARAIKAYDPSLKVGGPAIVGNLTFLDGFLDYCKEKEVPLDFVSWHIYTRDPREVYLRSKTIREMLRDHGFQDVESILTEWNISPDSNVLIFGTVEAAAFDASALIYMQDSPPDIATFYRGDTWYWGGLFDQDGVPRKAYYAFKAFRMLLDTPIRVSCNDSSDKSLAVIAGLSEDNRQATILISNYGSEFNSYNITFTSWPWRERQIAYQIYMLDHTYDLELVNHGKINSKSSLTLEAVDSPSVCLICLVCS